MFRKRPLLKRDNPEYENPRTTSEEEVRPNRDCVGAKVLGMYSWNEASIGNGFHWLNSAPMVDILILSNGHSREKFPHAQYNGLDMLGNRAALMCDAASGYSVSPSPSEFGVFARRFLRERIAVVIRGMALAAPLSVSHIHQKNYLWDPCSEVLGSFVNDS